MTKPARITPADVAEQHGVSYTTAWRWFLRAAKAAGIPRSDLQAHGRNVSALASRIGPFLPAPREYLVGADKWEAVLAQVRELQNRLDVEARERLKLADRVGALEKRAARDAFQF